MNLEEIFHGVIQTENEDAHHGCAQEFWDSPNQKARYNAANLCIAYSFCICEY